MSGEYDHLWSTNNGSVSWLNRATTEQREWLDGLVDTIIERGSEPTWSHVGKAFRAKFGLDKYPGDGTIKDHARKLVAERG